MPSPLPPEEPTGTWQGENSSKNENETLPASTEHARQLSLKSRSLVGQEFKGYRIVGEISQGGMGAVYHAVQAEPVRREVALKVVKFDSVSELWFKRFEAERQAMALMEHPCIARIFDGGTLPDGAPFLSMELVKGKPFSDFCDSQTLSVKQRLELLVQVCRAVQHAHDRGIIHRDLKPSNVLVVEVDGKPLPKVIDFGLAKSLDSETPIADTELTMHGTVMGTELYMSPEQAAGEPLDGRTDVFSLGVMLFESLVGSTPIEGKSLRSLQPLQRLEFIREHVPPRPSHRLAQSAERVTTLAELRSTSTSSLKSMLSGELDWIVLQAIDRDLDRRYESVQEFADDIERYLNHEPVLAKPPSVAYRAKKFVQRNRLQVALACTVLAAVLVVGFLLPALFSNQRNARLAKLKSGLLSHPSEFQLTAEEFQEQARLVEDIAPIDLAESEQASSSLTTLVTTALSLAIERPRLTEEARSQYENLFSALAGSPLFEAKQSELKVIEKRLQELKGAWVRVFSSKIGQPTSIAEAFEQGTFRVVEDGLKMTAQTDPTARTNQEKLYSFAWRASDIPVTKTKIACSGDTRVQATFSMAAKKSEVSIVLNSVKGTGYEFVLRRGETGLVPREGKREYSVRKFKEVRNEDQEATMLFAEIRRGDVILLRQEISPDQIENAAPFRITATREQNELAIQINGLLAQSIFDPFPLNNTEAGVIGLRVDPSVTLIGLETEMKPTAAQSSGLARGDKAFGRGEFDVALEAYQDERRQVQDLNLRAEAEYKAAISLQKLGRNKEASNLLQRLETGKRKPWSTLAAISIWDASLGELDLEKRRASLNRLLALQDASSVTSLLPEATRARIVQTQLSAFKMSDLIMPDRNRLDRVSFAAEMDRVLSIDGHGSLSGQTQYARALRFEGKLNEAAEVLKGLNERYDIPHLAVVYSRLLRVLNKPQDAFEFLQQKRERLEEDTPYLLHEQAMCEFALGLEIKGDSTIQSALGLGNSDPATVGALLLAQGFRQYRNGDLDLAQVTWRRGYLESRKQLDLNPDPNQSATITMLILGSLCGNLRPGDSEAFVNLMLNGPLGTTLRPAVNSIFPLRDIHRILLRMWKTDRGMEVAEDIAFARLDLRARTFGPAEVAAYQMLLDGAFGDKVGAEDREICQQISRLILQALFETNELNMFRIVTLGMAWKAGSGELSGLPEGLAAHAYYLLGNKLLRQGSVDDATAALKQALQMSPSTTRQRETLVRKRAAEMLALLEGGLGVVRFDGEPNVIQSLEVVGPEAASVDVTSAESGGRMLLAPGNYMIRSASESWNSEIQIDLGQTTFVTIPSKWAAGKQKGNIKGLLSHTAELPGIDDWQLVQDSMEASTHDLCWSPDGKRLAIVGDDTVRIANATTGEYQERIAVSGEQLRCVDWSSRNVLTVGTRTGKVFLINPNTHAISETEVRYPQRVASLQWNNAGTLLAVAGESSETQIYDEVGNPIQTVEGTTGNWMGKVCWSPSGKLLAILGTKELEVRNAATWNRVSRFDGINVGWDVLWSSDEEVLLVADNQHLRKISISDSKVQQELTGGAGAIIWANASETKVQGIWAGSDGLVTWDLTQGLKEPRAKRSLNGYDPLKLSSDGTQIARGNPNGAIISNSVFEQEVSVGKHPRIRILSTTFSMRHHLLAVLGKHVPKLKVLNMQDGSTRVYAPDEDFGSCCWSHDGECLAAGTQDGRVLFFTPNGELKHEEKISDNSVANLEWLPTDNSLIAGTNTGQLSLLRVKLKEGQISGSQKTLQKGDDQFTDWVGSHLALSPESTSGVYLRNGNLVRFELVPTFSKYQLAAPPPMPHNTVCFLSGERILAKRYGGYDFASAEDLWEPQTRRLSQTPTCFCELAPERLLFGTDDGVISALDLTNGTVEYLCDTGSELLSLDLLSEETVLAVNVYGTIRKINFQSGKVEQLAMLTQNESMLCVMGGGRLLSPEESLNGFSCIVSRDGKLESVPAVELLR